MSVREKELRQQIELVRNNVTKTKTTRLMPKVFQPILEEIKGVVIPRHFREPTIDPYEEQLTLKIMFFNIPDT